MSNLGIGLSSYANNATDGFGESSYADLQNLNKALEAGEITGMQTVNSLTDSGAPLKVESLEKTLKVITFKESDIVLWRDMPKLPAYNTVEEYNRLVSYGANTGGFHSEGALPEEEDSVYQRKAELVKFLGVTKSVTHPMSLVKTNIGDAVQREIKNGTMWILRKLDQAMTTANSGIIPVEFNGLYTQHQEGFANIGAYTSSDIVIDMRGFSLNESSIEEGVRTIVDNFGSADTLYAPPIVLSNFVKYFYQDYRYGSSDLDGSVGKKVTRFASQFGSIDLKFDKFLNKKANKTLLSSATSAKSANAPATTATALVAGAGSNFDAFDAGDYCWAVSAINQYGESALTCTTTVPITITAGDASDITVVDGGGTHPATGYRIYRSEKNLTGATNSTTFYPIVDVSVAQVTAGYDGGGAGDVRDMDRFMSDTDQAFILEKSEEILSFKQLAPLMKMDLAVIAPAYRFMVLAYGTPILYQPKKMVRFINIGTRV